MHLFAVSWWWRWARSQRCNWCWISTYWLSILVCQWSRRWKRYSGQNWWRSHQAWGYFCNHQAVEHFSWAGPGNESYQFYKNILIEFPLIVQVEKAFQRSFDNLNLGYIDLYLIHYPVAYRRVLQNIRLPSDDVNAFHVFPVDPKTGSSTVFYMSITKLLLLNRTQTTLLKPGLQGNIFFRQNSDIGCGLLGDVESFGETSRKRSSAFNWSFELQQRTNRAHSIDCQNKARHQSSRMPSKSQSAQIDWFYRGQEYHHYGLLTAGSTTHN